MSIKEHPDYEEEKNPLVVQGVAGSGMRNVQDLEQEKQRGP